MKTKRVPKTTIAVSLSALALSSGLAAAGSAGRSTAGIPRFCKEQQAKDALPTSPLQRGLRLAVSREGIQPGELVYARLLNFSDTTFGYGREFRIERYGSSGWTLDPSSPDGPFVRSLRKLPAENAGRCYGFRVPLAQANGRYRFSTKVFQRPGVSTRRTAEFTVHS